jgi:hypothetical protein
VDASAARLQLRRRSRGKLLHSVAAAPGLLHILLRRLGCHLLLLRGRRHLHVLLRPLLLRLLHVLLRWLLRILHLLRRRRLHVLHLLHLLLSLLGILLRWLLGIRDLLELRLLLHVMHLLLRLLHRRVWMLQTWRLQMEERGVVSWRKMLLLLLLRLRLLPRPMDRRLQMILNRRA